MPHHCLPFAHPLRAAGALAAAALTVGALTAFSSENTAGEDAVAIGGDFEFHSPGGATEIFYEPDERQAIGELQGDSLMEEGTQISLSDFEGQIVVLNAWGQWCAPCRSEVDDLEEVNDYLKDLDGTVLGIDVRDNNRQLAQDFVTDNYISYPSIYDPPFRSAAALGGVPSSVIPTTIVLDRQHRPAAVFLRSITTKEVTDVIAEIVGEE